MIKYLLPLISFFMGSAKNLFKEPGVALTQQLVLHLRAIGLMMATIIGSLTLFCVGMSLFISRFATQFDHPEGFTFTISMGIFLGLTVISIGVLAYSLRKKTWLEAMGFGQKATPPPGVGGKGGALESAVALLVMDFIEERQSRRKEKESSEQSA